MRSEERHAGAMESERKDWEIEFDLRSAKAAQASVGAQRKLDRWLESFRPKQSSSGRDPLAYDYAAEPVLSEHARRTSSMLLTVALALLAVWAVGEAMSTTAGGLIHVAALAAVALLALIWVRRVQFRSLI